MLRPDLMRAPAAWSIFGNMGPGARPQQAPQPNPRAKTDAELMRDALERDAVRKCSGMDMTNHITAWNRLSDLEGEHREALTAKGYSVQRIDGIRLYQIASGTRVFWCVYKILEGGW